MPNESQLTLTWIKDIGKSPSHSLSHYLLGSGSYTARIMIKLIIDYCMHIYLASYVPAWWWGEIKV
jgi:hypothetical protein